MAKELVSGIDSLLDTRSAEKNLQDTTTTAIMYGYLSGQKRARVEGALANFMAACLRLHLLLEHVSPAVARTDAFLNTTRRG